MQSSPRASSAAALVQVIRLGLPNNQLLSPEDGRLLSDVLAQYFRAVGDTRLVDTPTERVSLPALKRFLSSSHVWLPPNATAGHVEQLLDNPAVSEWIPAESDLSRRAATTLLRRPLTLERALGAIDSMVTNGVIGPNTGETWKDAITWAIGTWMTAVHKTSPASDPHFRSRPVPVAHLAAVFSRLPAPAGEAHMRDTYVTAVGSFLRAFASPTRAATDTTVAQRDGFIAWIGDVHAAGGISAVEKVQLQIIAGKYFDVVEQMAEDGGDLTSFHIDDVMLCGTHKGLAEREARLISPMIQRFRDEYPHLLGARAPTRHTAGDWFRHARDEGPESRLDRSRQISALLSKKYGGRWPLVPMAEIDFSALRSSAADRKVHGTLIVAKLDDSLAAYNTARGTAFGLSVNAPTPEASIAGGQVPAASDLGSPGLR